MSKITVREFLENHVTGPELCCFVIFDIDMSEFIRNENGEPFFGKSACPNEYLDNYLFNSIDGIFGETYFLTINACKAR